MVDIKGLPKSSVLRVLFNRSKQQGMDFMDPRGVKMMTEDDAAQIIQSCEGHLYFDYLMGRVMKVDLSKDEFDPWLYDRDNGQGAAEGAISQLR